MNVQEILEDKNIAYNKRGRDYIIHCLNPDHEDNNPSLRVDMLSGIFGCFSCSFSGNIYDYFGLQNISKQSNKIMEIKYKINDLMWSKPLHIPLDAVDFHQEYRNIKSTTFKHFKAFTTDSTILDMEGRVIIPITDISNNIISFNGRYIYSDLEPKYKNYPHTISLPLFPSNPKQINNSIILVEGIFDMLNLWDKGLTNVVCTFGINFGAIKKKVKQLANINRLLHYKYQGVTNIDIMYDGDDAGRKAAENLKSYIDKTFNVRIMYLEDGSDPGSLSINEVNYWKEKLYDKSSYS